VRLEGDQRRSASHSVNVTPHGQVELAVEAKPTFGTLEVAVMPRNATIAINGQRVGLGAYRSLLPAGSYVIEVDAPGVGSATTHVTMSAGHSVSKELVLVDRPTQDDAKDDQDERKAFRGFVGQFGLMAAQARHDGPGSMTEDTVSAGIPRAAGGAFLRLGRAVGPVSVEFTGAFLADTRGESQAESQCVQGAICVQTAYLSYGLGGFAGLGGHLSTTTQGIRFTAGGSFGAVYRNIRVVDEITGNRAASAGYYGPGALLDAGVLLGSTPGTKLFLGGILWWDNPMSEVTVDVPSGESESESLTVATGSQLYLGPALALQFGH